MRDDMPREVATAYWAGPHAEIVKQHPHLLEYIQRQFSPTDHGYWPATPRVGTLVAPSWRMDGFAEVRLRSLAIAALTTPLHMRGVFLDEQNVFQRVFGHLTGPHGGRWWTAGHDDAELHRTAVLLRRRRGVSGRAFRRFVHAELGPALDAAGARDLRTYTFLPYTPLAHMTPGVSHDNPASREYHGALVIGASSRDHLVELMDSRGVSAVIGDQARVLTAAHAYTVERSVAVIHNR
ncbi:MULTISPECIES: hypothetical protein [Nocardia]|uniref:hypothetical protein n=1 Tax=Nocardia TaxID=1817 RepID=UPI0012EDFE81|nr:MULTISPECIES: hypothetical protein [Nocardia]